METRVGRSLRHFHHGGNRELSFTVHCPQGPAQTQPRGYLSSCGSLAANLEVGTHCLLCVCTQGDRDTVEGQGRQGVGKPVGACCPARQTLGSWSSSCWERCLTTCTPNQSAAWSPTCDGLATHLTEPLWSEGLMSALLGGLPAGLLWGGPY